MADISNQFEFFENYNPNENNRKEIRVTPPGDDVVKQQISAYGEGTENGIKVDGIKIDALKIDGVVDRAKSSYIDRVKKSETFRNQQGIIDMRKAKQNSTESKVVNVGNNQPTTELKSSAEENRRCYDESETESEISSRKPGYLDADLEHARQAARARDLKDRFERWNYENNVYDTSAYNDSIPEYDEIDDSQTETTKTLVFLSI